jgi:hypothetical protein
MTFIVLYVVAIMLYLTVADWTMRRLRSDKATCHIDRIVLLTPLMR